MANTKQTTKPIENNWQITHPATGEVIPFLGCSDYACAYSTLQEWSQIYGVDVSRTILELDPFWQPSY